MKTTAVIVIFLFNSILSTAQLKKGQWMMGGTAHLSHAINDYSYSNFHNRTKQTVYDLFPGVGYFIGDRLVAGPRIHISSAETKEKSTNPGFALEYRNETKKTGHGFGAFARYYLFKSTKKFNAFAEGAWSYSFENAKTKTYQVYTPSGGFPVITESHTSSKYRLNNYSLMAGPVLFLSSKVSFELSAGYTHASGSDKLTNYDLKSNRFIVGTGFHVFFGK